MRLKLAGIVKESVVDGPGIRMAVFVQGCPHHCPGCHNPTSHDPDGGFESTTENLLLQLKENHLASGITFSGGEPFDQAEAVALLAAEVKLLGKSVVTYTGYAFEHLMGLGKQNIAVAKLLENTDILVDGPYMESQRDISLAFRGSANQRLIDVPETLRQGKIVGWVDTAWICS
jgi:anaerobic ribonucleoside-triphosphate reductase activating protein